MYIIRPLQNDPKQEGVTYCMGAYSWISVILAIGCLSASMAWGSPHEQELKTNCHIYIYIYYIYILYIIYIYIYIYIY